MKASSSSKSRVPASSLRLRLYVAGQLACSAEAAVNIQALCAEMTDPGATIEIVDVLQDPDGAMRDGIIVTPTLLRLSPAPVVRIFGNLSDAARVRAALGIAVQPHA